MKKEIHPQYFEKAKVRCSCGAEFEVGATVEEFKLDICSQCHPLYTGNKKFVDTAGRLDKFNERLAKTQKLQDELKAKRAGKVKAELETTVTAEPDKQ